MSTTMDTPTPREDRPGPRLMGPAPGVLRPRRVSGTVRTCVPARCGQAGYREPANGEESDAHIVRGED